MRYAEAKEMQAATSGNSPLRLVVVPKQTEHVFEGFVSDILEDCSPPMIHVVISGVTVPVERHNWGVWSIGAADRSGTSPLRTGDKVVLTTIADDTGFRRWVIKIGSV